MIRVTLALCAAMSCNRSRAITDHATVRAIGAVETHDGIEIEYDACRDVHDVFFFDTKPPMPPVTVTCLRGLGVGTKVDVTMESSHNAQVKGWHVTRIGACALPADIDGVTKTSGPGRCSWN